ncbi:MAG TPA: hypothetical protein VNY77_01190 [Candidatus Angelobacter sp.]|nr:hypothetical protein [Candidatus Angelobacter sp.]
MRLTTSNRRAAAAGQFRALASQLLRQCRHYVINKAGHRPGTGLQRLAQHRWPPFR